jgi:disulfide bond formation protein DsbB
VGLTLGLSLGGIGLAGARSSRARALFGAVTALLGTLVGLLGCALALFQMSEHWAAHQNPTLLACPPWALALSWSGIQLARGRRSRLLRVALGASLVTSSALLLLALWPPHDSLRQAALFVPLWAGWLYGAAKQPDAIRGLAPRAA